MKVDKNDKMKLERDYVTFRFDWYWIRDKQIVHNGNDYYGMIIIQDERGRAVKVYGYELISENEK